MSRRRRALIGGCAAIVVAFAAGLGIATGTGTGSSSAEEAGRRLAIPANSQGWNGTLIAFGDSEARTTVKVYEDLRCPYCAEFERKLGPTLNEMVDTGKVRVEFHLAAFLDKSLGGQGSRTSIAALGAALNESPAKFRSFHDVLFAHQPAHEGDDAFGSTARLLELAGKVPGLRTPSFNKAVKEKTYAAWADKVADAFYESDVTGTPTVQADDKKLTVIDEHGTAVSPKDFTRQVNAAIDGS
ncbi:thioredoxin domain-containing protein [Streptomyces sp. NPDC054855]